MATSGLGGAIATSHGQRAEQEQSREQAVCTWKRGAHMHTRVALTSLATLLQQAFLHLARSRRRHGTSRGGGAAIETCSSGPGGAGVSALRGRHANHSGARLAQANCGTAAQTGGDVTLPKRPQAGPSQSLSYPLNHRPRRSSARHLAAGGRLAHTPKNAFLALMTQPENRRATLVAGRSCTGSLRRSVAGARSG
jgi:hypothetical protein